MDRYLLTYNAYKKWQKENEEHLSSSEEANLIVCFNQQKKKLAPSTIWSMWSMLRLLMHVFFTPAPDQQNLGYASVLQMSAGVKNKYKNIHITE